MMTRQVVSKRKALVVVLGELARSPRMQYQCISLAKDDYQVTVIANSGNDKCCEELESNQLIEQKFIPDFKVSWLPRSFSYILRPICQSLLLLITLFQLIFTFKLPHIILLQNPPSIPTIPVMVVFSKLTNSRFIIDWHNYGYSILALKLGQDHLLVKIYQWIEFFFGRHADAGFCVSESMRESLIKHHKIKYPLKVLYDKPPIHFKSMKPKDKHKFFIKMKQTIKEFRSPMDDDTRFTIHDPFNKRLIVNRPLRPAILLSSTSWTEDEDFDMLLDALKLYDNTRSGQIFDESYICNNDDQFCLPNLVCVITGKGPLKSYYETKIKEYNFHHVEIILPWLASVDYPEMVGSADLGVCLHSSSSRVDLPMKVVDMFGCSVPVLAYHYDAISELVVEDFFGMTFHDKNDLFQKIVLLLRDFHEDDRVPISNRNSKSSLLNQFRKNISRFYLKNRWEDNWISEAKPLLQKLRPDKERKLDRKNSINLITNQ